MGLISCVFWPMAHGAVLQSHTCSVMVEWIYLVYQITTVSLSFSFVVCLFGTLPVYDLVTEKV